MYDFLDLTKPMEVICFSSKKYKPVKVTAVGMNKISDEDGENQVSEMWFSVEFEDGVSRRVIDPFGMMKDEWRYVL